MAVLIAEVFLRDYFDNLLDEHELSETLLGWLVEGGFYEGPINSFEDAEIVDVELGEAEAQLEEGGLVVRAVYTARLRGDYVDREGRDHVLSAAFALSGSFYLAGGRAQSVGGEVAAAWQLGQARPAEEIRLLEDE